MPLEHHSSKANLSGALSTSSISEDSQDSYMTFESIPGDERLEVFLSLHEKYEKHLPNLLPFLKSSKNVQSSASNFEQAVLENLDLFPRNSGNIGELEQYDRDDLEYWKAEISKLERLCANTEDISLTVIQLEELIALLEHEHMHHHSANIEQLKATIDNISPDPESIKETIKKLEDIYCKIHRIIEPNSNIISIKEHIWTLYSILVSQNINNALQILENARLNLKTTQNSEKDTEHSRQQIKQAIKLIAYAATPDQMIAIETQIEELNALLDDPNFCYKKKYLDQRHRPIAAIENNPTTIAKDLNDAKTLYRKIKDNSTEYRTFLEESKNYLSHYHGRVCFIGEVKGHFKEYKKCIKEQYMEYLKAHPELVGNHGYFACPDNPLLETYINLLQLQSLQKAMCQWLEIRKKSNPQSRKRSSSECAVSDIEFSDAEEEQISNCEGSQAPLTSLKGSDSEGMPGEGLDSKEEKIPNCEGSQAPLPSPEGSDYEDMPSLEGSDSEEECEGSQAPSQDLQYTISANLPNTDTLQQNT